MNDQPHQGWVKSRLQPSGRFLINGGEDVCQLQQQPPGRRSALLHLVIYMNGSGLAKGLSAPPVSWLAAAAAAKGSPTIVSFCFEVAQL